MVAVAAFAGTAWVATATRPPPRHTGAAAARTLRIIFPEGFTVAEMADRVDAVREIAIAKRDVTPGLTKAGYLARRRAG